MILLGSLAYFIARTVTLSRSSRLAFIPFVVWVANVFAASVVSVLLLPSFIQGVVENEVERGSRKPRPSAALADHGHLVRRRLPGWSARPPFTCHISSDTGFQFDFDVAIVDGAFVTAVDESTRVPNAG